MTDTLELLKTKLASDIGGRQSYCNNVRNAVLACALRKMSCGALRAYYGEEGDAWDAIERCVTKEAMEEVLGDKYRSAMRYGTDPAEAVRISRIVSDVEDYFGTKLDRYAIGLFSERKVACSCGTECVFLPGSDPGNQRGEDIWLCPSCGASVGCHSGTNIPLGIPASGETSVLRVRIHEEIDRLVPRVEMKDEAGESGSCSPGFRGTGSIVSSREKWHSRLKRPMPGCSTGGSARKLSES